MSPGSVHQLWAVVIIHSLCTFLQPNCGALPLFFAPREQWAANLIRVLITQPSRGTLRRLAEPQSRIKKWLKPLL